MSVEACAAIVERGDPDRFRSVMAAPVATRRILFPLYAFNVEVSRAPWVTSEAMIAEMRLQWWRDALEEIGTGSGRRHEVVDALAQILDDQAVVDLDGLVAARRWDVYTDAFEGPAHFADYIAATSGALMGTAARLLGQGPVPAVADMAYASGVAALLRAVPELETRGRKPLVDGRPEAVAALAQEALDRLNRAAGQRRQVDAAGPALLSGWAARPTLRQAAAQPARVAAGDLGHGALRFSWVALAGWWR